VNAGHNPPVVFRQTDTRRARVLHEEVPASFTNSILADIGTVKKQTRIT
jgi:hypothetical protein